ncbi:SPASM domain-containing protein, partial [Acidobacteriota bacterium]
EAARKLSSDLGISFRDNQPMINFGLNHTFDEAFEAQKDWIDDLPSWLAHRNDVRDLRMKKGFCEWPWLNMAVEWDGTVKPCCYVYPWKHSFGNILTQDVKAVWNGESYRNARRFIRSGKSPDDGICCFCREHSG